MVSNYAEEERRKNRDREDRRSRKRDARLVEERSGLEAGGRRSHFLKRGDELD